LWVKQYTSRSYWFMALISVDVLVIYHGFGRCRAGQLELDPWSLWVRRVGGNAEYDPVSDGMASIKGGHGVNVGGACGVNVQLTLRSSSAGSARILLIDCLVLGSSARTPWSGRNNREHTEDVNVRLPPALLQAATVHRHALAMTELWYNRRQACNCKCAVYSFHIRSPAIFHRQTIYIVWPSF
jgi:hypothetical protein